MKHITLVSVLSMLLLLGGCASPADISRVKHFESGDVAFDYPFNWKITKHEALPERWFTVVEGSGFGIAILTHYGSGHDIDVEEYSTTFHTAMSTKEPIALVKHTNDKNEVIGLDYRSNNGFSGVRVPHTVNITKHVFEQLVVVCLTQVADEDRYLVSPGFDLIRHTLRVDNTSKPNKAPEPTPTAAALR